MATVGELVRDNVVVHKIFPAQGNKSGKIKTDKGFFSAWPEKLNLFNDGFAYDIVFDQYQKGNVVYRDVKEVHEIGPALAQRQQQEPQRAQAAQQSGAAVQRGPVPNGNGHHEPPPHHEIPPGPSGPAPHGLGPRNGDDPYWRPKPQAPEDQERIFVAGALYRDIEMGRVFDSEDHLVERIEMWRRVWARTFGLAA
jgi:hypothetical protein